MRMLRFAPRAFAIVAFAAAAMPAPAQEWPSGTVRVVVPYAAGAGMVTAVKAATAKARAANRSMRIRQLLRPDPFDDPRSASKWK